MPTQKEIDLNLKKKDEKSKFKSVLFVLLFYAILIFSFKNSYPLWFDEVFTAYWIEQPQSYLWGKGRLEESSPPLFYSVLRVWAGMFGNGEAALRALSTLMIGTAALLALTLGWIVGGQRVGTIAGLTFASVPVVTLFAQEVRSVALLPLLQGLIVLAAAVELRWATTVTGTPSSRFLGSPGSAAILIVASVLSVYAHPLSGFFVAAAFTVLGLLALTRRDLGWPMLLRWSGLAAISLILIVPQAIVTLSLAKAGAAGWMDPLDLREAARILFGLFLGEGAYGWPLTLRVAAALALLGLMALGVRALPRPLAVVIAGIPILFVIMLFVYSLHDRVVQVRYMLGVTVPLAVLASAGALSLQPIRAHRNILIVLLIAGLTSLSWRQATRGWEGEWHPTQDWRGVTTLLRTDPSCRGPIFSNVLPGLAAWPYYDREGLLGTRFLVQQDGESTGALGAFLHRATGSRAVPPQYFEGALAAGGPLAVVLVGRRAEESRFARTVGTHRGDAQLTRHHFPPGLTVYCISRTRGTPARGFVEHIPTRTNDLIE